MTLNDTLLQKLGKWKPADRQTLDATEAGWTVAVTADRNDDVGCLVWDLAVSRTPAPEEPILVREWADRVAGRVRGLMENLKLLEVDGPRQALLRSDEPTKRGDDVFYYELQLNCGGSASVRRFQASRQHGRREQVPFALTHEVLGKLVSDLTADR